MGERCDRCGFALLIGEGHDERDFGLPPLCRLCEERTMVEEMEHWGPPEYFCRVVGDELYLMWNPQIPGLERTHEPEERGRD
jgi:hypothetical protein